MKTFNFFLSCTIILLLIGCSSKKDEIEEPLDEEPANTITVGEIPDESLYQVLDKSVQFNRESDEVFRLDLFSEESIGFDVSVDIDEDLLDMSITFITISIVDLDQEINFFDVIESTNLFFINPANEGDLITDSSDFSWFSPQAIYSGKDNAFRTILNAFDGFYVPFKIRRNGVDLIGWIKMQLVTSDIRVEGFKLVDMAWIELSE